MNIIVDSLVVMAAAGAALSTSTDDSSVLVESPTLYIHRMPQRRSKMNNLDARPQVPDLSSTNASVYSDVGMSEMMSDEVNQDDFFALALTPGTRQFYFMLTIGLSVLTCAVTVLLWWLCCRPKPIPRRFNPRYDGAPPKRLSRLSFRAIRYSMTGNQQVKSNQHSSPESQMEPAQSVSAIPVVVAR